MPITSCTIGGTEFNPLVERFEISKTAGEVGTLSCDVVSTGSPVLRPEIHQLIIIEEDGVPIFSGRVTQVRERGHGGPNLYDATYDAPEIVTTVTAEDYNRYLERIHVTETVAEGTTLEAFLIVLTGAPYLGGIGITLHPSQVTGPTLPAMEFVREKPADILRALADATGYVFDVDNEAQLRMWSPGDIAAPFDIDEFDDPVRWTDDVEVERILGDEYANRVIVTVGPIEDENHEEFFTGDGVTDTFPLTWTPTGFPRGYVTDDYNASPQINFTFTTIEFQGSASWTYDPSNNSLIREVGPLPNGQVASIKFPGVLTLTATAEDAGEIAANGLYEHLEPPHNEITTQAGLDDLAATILAERLVAGDQSVFYATRYVAPTLAPGQQQAITATARDISGNYLIADMRIIAETPATATYAATGLGLLRRIRAKKFQLLTGRMQDTYRDWLDRGKSAVPTIQVGSGDVFSLAQTNRHPHMLYRRSHAVLPSMQGVTIWHNFNIESTPTVAGTTAQVVEAEFFGRRVTSTAVSGNVARVSHGSMAVYPIADPILYVRFRTGSDVTSTRLWCGLANLNTGDQDSLSLARVAAIRYSTVAGDGGFVGLTQNATGSFTVSSVISAIAANTEYLARIRFSGDGASVHFSINNGAEQTVTTNMPDNNVTMFLNLSVATQTAATRYFDFGAAVIETVGGQRVVPPEP